MDDPYILESSALQPRRIRRTSTQSASCTQAARSEQQAAKPRLALRWAQQSGLQGADSNQQSTGQRCSRSTTTRGDACKPFARVAKPEPCAQGCGFQTRREAWQTKSLGPIAPRSMGSQQPSLAAQFVTAHGHNAAFVQTLCWQCGTRITAERRGNFSFPSLQPHELVQVAGVVLQPVEPNSIQSVGSGC